MAFLIRVWFKGGNVDYCKHLELGKDFTSIPPEIVNFKNLKNLTVDCGLKTLPQELLQLPHLKRINAAENPLGRDKSLVITQLRARDCYVDTTGIFEEIMEIICKHRISASSLELSSFFIFLFIIQILLLLDSLIRAIYQRYFT